jgi:CubicO group peptidase (beta-lactamase class C family)
VLGVLLARAAGKGLAGLMHERIFEPLGMTDSGFTVPGEQLGRLTTFYSPDPATGELSVLDDPADSWWSRPPRFPDASGWLVSTIDDYWAFVSMLLAGGSLNGERIVSSRSMTRMTTDCLTPAQRVDTGVFLGEHEGWGLGMGTPRTGSTGQPLPCGFGWDGGSGTTWRSNPEHGVTAILLTQRQLASPVLPPVFDDLWRGAKAAAAGTTG